MEGVTVLGPLLVSRLRKAMARGTGTGEREYAEVCGVCIYGWPGRRFRETSESSTRLGGGDFHTNTPLLSERIIRSFRRIVQVLGETKIKFAEGSREGLSADHRFMSAG